MVGKIGDEDALGIHRVGDEVMVKVVQVNLDDRKIGIIRTFVRHPNAANLLMALMIIGGLILVTTIVGAAMLISSWRLRTWIFWAGIFVVGTGAVILSFLGGVRWGAAAASGNGRPVDRQSPSGSVTESAGCRSR